MIIHRGKVITLLVGAGTRLERQALYLRIQNDKNYRKDYSLDLRNVASPQRIEELIGKLIVAKGSVVANTFIVFELLEVDC